MTNAKQSGGMALGHRRLIGLGLCVVALVALAGCKTVKTGEFGEDETTYKRSLSVPMFGKVGGDDSKFSYLYEEKPDGSVKYHIIEGQSVEGIDNSNQLEAMRMGMEAVLMGMRIGAASQGVPVGVGGPAATPVPAPGLSAEDIAALRDIIAQFREGDE